jgi:hypothetical protein
MAMASRRNLAVDPCRKMPIPGQDQHARPVLAQRIDLPVFKHAQERGLQLERHLPDLVQEQGPAMGRLDPPNPAGAARPAERSLDIADELTRQEVPWEPTAVECDEWPMLARPAHMDRAGKDLLADTGLPLQQHRFG